MKKLLLLTLLLAACTKSPPTPAPVPKGPVAPSMGGSFTEFIPPLLTDAMKKNAKPGDLCPKYAPALASDFWVALVTCTVSSESSFKPDTVYTEKFVDHLTGKPAQSVGYLQLSVGDKLNYKTPNCKDLTNESLKDPSTNLKCGVEIMDALLTRRGPEVRKSLGAYWSTIRDGKIDQCMKESIKECYATK